MKNSSRPALDLSYAEEKFFSSPSRSKDDSSNGQSDEVPVRRDSNHITFSSELPRETFGLKKNLYSPRVRFSLQERKELFDGQKKAFELESKRLDELISDSLSPREETQNNKPHQNDSNSHSESEIKRLKMELEEERRKFRILELKLKSKAKSDAETQTIESTQGQEQNLKKIETLEKLLEEERWKIGEIMKENSALSLSQTETLRELQIAQRQTVQLKEKLIEKVEGMEADVYKSPIETPRLLSELKSLLADPLGASSPSTEKRKVDRFSEGEVSGLKLERENLLREIESMRKKDTEKGKRDRGLFLQLAQWESDKGDYLREIDYLRSTLDQKEEELKKLRRERSDLEIPTGQEKSGSMQLVQQIAQMREKMQKIANEKDAIEKELWEVRKEKRGKISRSSSIESLEATRNYFDKMEEELAQVKEERDRLTQRLKEVKLEQEKERKRTQETLLHQMDQISTEADSEVQALRNEMKEQETRLGKEIARLQHNENLMKEELRRIEKRAQFLQMENEKIKEEHQKVLQEAKEKSNQMELSEKKAAQLNVELKRLETENTQLLVTKSHLEESLDKTERELVKQRELIAEEVEKVKDITKEEKEVKATLHKTEEEKRKLEVKLEASSQDFERLREEKESLSEEIATIQNDLIAFGEMEAASQKTLQETKRKLSKVTKLAQKYKKENETLKEMLEKHESGRKIDLENLEKHLGELERTQEELNSMFTEKQLLQERVRELEWDLHRISLQHSEESHQYTRAMEREIALGHRDHRMMQILEDAEEESRSSLRYSGQLERAKSSLSRCERETLSLLHLIQQLRTELSEYSFDESNLLEEVLQSWKSFLSFDFGSEQKRREAHFEELKRKFFRQSSKKAEVMDLLNRIHFSCKELANYLDG